MAGNYQAWVEVVPEFKGFNKSVNKNVTESLGAAGDEGAKTFGGRLAGALGAVAKPLAIAGGIALAGVGVAAGAALTKGLDRSLSIQDATAKLTGLGHSGEAVQVIMNNALASVRGTAFGLGDAAGVAAGAVAAGIEPGEKLTRVLKLTADAATIAGTDLNSMGSIFNKVAASGKLQGDVIAQLQDAGVPVLQFVAKQMGVTAGEAVKLASEGKVSFETFADAMEAGLGGAALSSGNTARGAFANVGAALGRLGAMFTTPAVEGAPAFFSSLSVAIDAAAAKAKPFADRWSGFVKPALTDAAAAITSIVSGEPSKLTPYLDKVNGALDRAKLLLLPFKSAWAELQPIFAPLLPQLSLLATALSPLGIVLRAIAPSLPEVATGLANIGATASGALGSALTSLLPPLTQLANSLSTQLASALIEAQPSLAALGSNLLTLAKSTLPELLPAVTDLVVALIPLVTMLTGLAVQVLPLVTTALAALTTPLDDNATGAGAFLTVLTGVVSALTWLIAYSPSLTSDLAFLSDAFGKNGDQATAVADALNGKYGPALQQVAERGIAIGTAINNAFESARQGIYTALDLVNAKANAVWNAIPAPARNAISQAAAFIQNGVSNIGAIFQDIPRSAAVALQGVIGSFAGAGRDAVNGFINGIVGGIGRAAEAAARMAQTALNAAKAALDIHSPSRVFRDEVGVQMGAGMIVGLQSMKPKIDASIAAVAEVDRSGLRADLASIGQNDPSAALSRGGDTWNIYGQSDPDGTALAVSRRQKGFGI